MGQYMVVNRHGLEECEQMEIAMDRLPERVRGRDFLCTCPEGPHGFYMVLPGESAQEVIASLPPEWRRGSAAYPVEIVRL